jgi:hypothetical protein
VTTRKAKDKAALRPFIPQAPSPSLSSESSVSKRANARYFNIAVNARLRLGNVIERVGKLEGFEGMTALKIAALVADVENNGITGFLDGFALGGFKVFREFRGEFVSSDDSRPTVVARGFEVLRGQSVFGLAAASDKKRSYVIFPCVVE